MTRALQRKQEMRNREAQGAVLKRRSGGSEANANPAPKGGGKGKGKSKSKSKPPAQSGNSGRTKLDPKGVCYYFNFGGCQRDDCRFIHNMLSRDDKALIPVPRKSQSPGKGSGGKGSGSSPKKSKSPVRGEKPKGKGKSRGTTPSGPKGGHGVSSTSLLKVATSRVASTRISLLKPSRRRRGRVQRRSLNDARWGLTWRTWVVRVPRKQPFVM